MYILHCHNPIGFALGEVNEVLSLQMSRDHGRYFLFISFVKKIHSYKERIEVEGGEGQTWR